MHDVYIVNFIRRLKCTLLPTLFDLFNARKYANCVHSCMFKLNRVNAICM